MAIYLGGNNSRPYFGGVKINEAYLGSVKVLNGGMPVLAPSSMRFQFDEDGYDPTAAISGGVTLASKGWTCIRRSSTIWDFTHTENFSADALAAFYSGGTNIPTQPYRVLEVNVGSSWNYYRALFHNQAYLDSVPLFDIVSSGTSDNFFLMFGSCPNFNNTVDWLKKIASVFQGYTVSAISSSTKSASSIPTNFGGTKGRTVTVDPGWVTVTSSSPYTYTVSVAPGDVLICRARNYGLARNTRCQASWVSGSFVNNNGLPNAYVTAKNTRSDPNTTFRWGYANGSRRSVKVNGTTTNTLTSSTYYSRVAVYLESFNFL